MPMDLTQISDALLIETLMFHIGNIFIESRFTLKEYFERLLTVPDFKIALKSKTIFKHAERFLSDTDQSMKCQMITKG